MSETMKPLVSIGMPVYNAEKYLAGALQSLLAQDYSAFELIISDNGSSDQTEAICVEFQKLDQRIRYIRQPENLGAPMNFAFVVGEAKGEYFMWAAHDDLFHPSYIRKCAEKLAAHPEAALCCTEIDFIDAEGRPHFDWSKKNYKNIETLGMTPPQRIHELINRAGWFAIYGMMPLESAKKMSLGLSCYGADVIMLMELLLEGDFVKVHEPLFSYRMVKAKTAEDYQADFNSESNPTSSTVTPYADLATNLLQTVYRSQLTRAQKREVFADFLITLSQPGSWWRKQITTELIGKGADLNDSAFALLLTAVLSRSMPLDTMKDNPLIAAIGHASTGEADLLKVAHALRARQGEPVQPMDSHQEAVRLFGEERFEESAKLFDEALRQQESSELWSDWATAQLACNRAVDAERGFRRALALDADNDLATLKLGVLLANLERNSEAAFYLERCVSRTMEPDRTEILQLLARCQSLSATH